MLAVGRGADALEGDERWVPLVHPQNPRSEVHYDEDFHSSGMIVPSTLISRSGLPVSPNRRDVSVTLSSETVSPPPNPRRRRMPLPPRISTSPSTSTRAA